MQHNDISQLVYSNDGLIPVIVQDHETLEVLMLAYMNKEALEISMLEKEATYYSRSRKKLWKKGETSGHIQVIQSLSYDCDQDTLLMKVKQVGVACHTNRMSCFFRELFSQHIKPNQRFVLEELYATIQERKTNPVEGSYTNYLFSKGTDKILKKVGEESAEVIIASKNQNKEEMTLEISDLIYHLMVLMVNENVTLEMIFDELNKRRKKGVES